MTEPEQDIAEVHWSRLREDIAVVIWTSFLVACIAATLCFAFLDPLDLAAALGRPRWLPSRMSGYALGFFFFWFVAASAASMTAYMLDTSHEHFIPPSPGPRQQGRST